MDCKGDTVMGYQAVFKRYEIRYMITSVQKDRILRAMEPYMEADKFGRSTIRNIYYDTDDYILARHSIAKPDFKEKLRVRSYQRADAESTVFVELKRKFDKVVYKRRIGLPEGDAVRWMAGAMTDHIREELDGESPQVAAEIAYFLDTYKGLRPAMYLSYEREAFRMRPGTDRLDGGADFRVTFDENILCRDSDMSLESESYGERLLDEGMVLMELKCSGGIPLWMTEVLSAERIYKTSFSKYGKAYQTMIFPALMQERRQEAAAAAASATSEERTNGGEGRRREKRRTSRRYSGKHAKHAQRRFHFGFGHQRATA